MKKLILITFAIIAIVLSSMNSNAQKSKGVSLKIQETGYFFTVSTGVGQELNNFHSDSRFQMISFKLGQHIDLSSSKSKTKFIGGLSGGFGVNSTYLQAEVGAEFQTKNMAYSFYLFNVYVGKMIVPEKREDYYKRGINSGINGQVYFKKLPFDLSIKSSVFYSGTILSHYEWKSWDSIHCPGVYANLILCPGKEIYLESIQTIIDVCVNTGVLIYSEKEMLADLRAKEILARKSKLSPTIRPGITIIQRFKGIKDYSFSINASYEFFELSEAFPSGLVLKFSFRKKL